MRPGFTQKVFLVSFMFGRNAVFKTSNAQDSAKYNDVKMNTGELIL